MNEALNVTMVPGTERTAQLLDAAAAAHASPEVHVTPLAQQPMPASQAGLVVTRSDSGPVASTPRAYVVGYMFNPEKTAVALIEKQKPAWQRGKFNGIGGHIEADETPEAAMSREFEEEAGVFVHPDDWLLIRVEQFLDTSEYKSDQDSGTTVYHFGRVATIEEWEELHTAEKEVVTKMKYPFHEHTIPRLLYNMPYLVPMAAILLDQPVENRPLP